MHLRTVFFGLQYQHQTSSTFIKQKCLQTSNAFLFEEAYRWKHMVEEIANMKQHFQNEIEEMKIEFNNLKQECKNDLSNSEGKRIF